MEVKRVIQKEDKIDKNKGKKVHRGINIEYHEREEIFLPEGEGGWGFQSRIYTPAA